MARVKVYSEQLARTLLEDDDDDPHASWRRSRGGSRLSSRQRAELAKIEKMAHRHEIYTHEQEQVQRNNLRAVKERLAKKAMKKEAKFVVGFNKIMEGQKMTRELQTMLLLNEATEARKCRQEYEAWDKQVYGELSSAIQKKVKAIPYHSINERKRGEFQQYLDQVRRKDGAVFRDIILENEYDPLESNRKDIHLRHPKMNDPTSRCLDKDAEERGMVEGDADDANRGGRYTLEVEHWATGKIEATPHGHFAHMMGNAKVLDERMEKLTASHLFLDHFTAPTGNEVAAKEFPLGKKCDYF